MAFNRPVPEESFALTDPISVTNVSAPATGQLAWDTRGYGSETFGVLRYLSERYRRLVLIVIFALLILTFGTLFLTILTSLTEFVREMWMP